MYHDTPDSHIDDLIANYISNGLLFVVYNRALIKSQKKN